MKRSHSIPLVFLAVFGLSLTFAAVASSESPATSRPPANVPIALETNTVCDRPCRLVVTEDADTLLDRGLLQALPADGELVGAYRYQLEQAGAMLYVYDDVGNLITRVRNPQSVIALGDPGPRS